MELRDIYDFQGRKTGKIIGRQEPLLEGEYCRTVCVCLFNSEGRMLLQKRTSNKALWPDLWDVTAAGGVLAGETGQMAAERELFEEMGIRVSFQNHRPSLTTYFDGGFSDVFMVTMDVEPETLCLQAEEVCGVRWASLEEILDMAEKGEFIPYFVSYIRVLFDIYHNHNIFILK